MKTLLIICSILCLLACNRKLTSVYFYDNTKVDDGEITATYLNGFFIRDKNVHVSKVNSKYFFDELMIIRNQIKATVSKDEFDDGFYGYAFITSSNDTLYADYNLTFWRNRVNGIYYRNDSIKSIINESLNSVRPGSLP